MLQVCSYYIAWTNLSKGTKQKSAIRFVRMLLFLSKDLPFMFLLKGNDRKKWRFFLARMQLIMCQSEVAFLSYLILMMDTLKIELER